MKIKWSENHLSVHFIGMYKMKENIIINNRNVLIHDLGYRNDIVDNFKPNFCGTVYDSVEAFVNDKKIGRVTVYYCGQVDKQFYNDIGNHKVDKVYFIEGCISNEAEIGTYISWQEVPQNIHNVGVWFQKLFQSDKNYFKAVNTEHKFQTLTESNKPGHALRSGIYMTPVEERDGIYFNLLRCSSNFDGPTDNYRETDHEIVNLVNERVRLCFQTPTTLNHTLAQIYHNIIDETGKTHKAKIREHSDKTKDMPLNGLIAFCTFYEEFDGKDGFNGLDKIKYDPIENDYTYKNTSVLTRLRFRLKPDVTDDSYTKRFDIILLPNSVFVISLLTNRLYTHEIVPSGLEVQYLPTRMGYVIRCSNTQAVYRNGRTFLIREDEEIPLEEPTKDGIETLKGLYYKENSTAEMVTYDQIYFSVNKGDYLAPEHRVSYP